MTRLHSTFRLGILLGAPLALALWATPAGAVTDTAFSAAFTQFRAGNSGDSSAVEASADAFTALLKAEPSHPVLMVYAGAATTLKATTTFLPWKKMGFAEDGLAQIDKALALLTPAHDNLLVRGTPAPLEVKFVAANTFLAVPGFMNRGARGAKLLAEVQASPLFAASPLPFKADVWMRAATQAMTDQQPQEARRLLGEVISSQAPQAEAAKTKLKAIAP